MPQKTKNTVIYLKESLDSILCHN